MTSDWVNGQGERLPARNLHKKWQNQRGANGSPCKVKLLNTETKDADSYSSSLQDNGKIWKFINIKDGQWKHDDEWKLKVLENTRVTKYPCMLDFVHDTSAHLEIAIKKVRNWMSSNQLKLNASKTELIVIQDKNQVEYLLGILLCVFLEKRLTHLTN